jgi:hypothetical protein
VILDLAESVLSVGDQLCEIGVSSLDLCPAFISFWWYFISLALRFEERSYLPRLQRAREKILLT